MQESLPSKNISRLEVCHLGHMLKARGQEKAYVTKQEESREKGDWGQRYHVIMGFQPTRVRNYMYHDSNSIDDSEPLYRGI